MRNKRELLPIGTKIRHKEHSCLLGEIAGHDYGNEEKYYRIAWKEPWFAASIIEKPEDFLFLSEDEFELLDSSFQPLLKNQPCPTCNGAKGFKVQSKMQQFYWGLWRVCETCQGTGVVYGKGIVLKGALK